MDEATVSVTLPLPDTSPPQTEPTNPSTVLIVQPPSTDGSAIIDLQARIRELEAKNADLTKAQEATAVLASSAMTEARVAQVQTDQIPTEKVVPLNLGSSDDGPPASETEEKPAPKKRWWDHWI